MSFISFLLGAVVGAIAMKFYIDKHNEEDAQSSEHVMNARHKDESNLPEAMEITTDGTVTIEPSDKDIITAAIKALKKAKSRVSIASVVRESGLSTYRVSKHKELIEKHK